MAFKNPIDWVGYAIGPSDAAAAVPDPLVGFGGIMDWTGIWAASGAAAVPPTPDATVDIYHWLYRRKCRGR